MHGMIVHGGRGLKGARMALRGGKPEMAPAASAGLVADFAGRVLEFSAAVSGYAAENMVRGGGRLFLDLGRRIERAHAIAAQLAHALDVPPARVEAGLGLALELCDSVLTYRSRYLSVLQPAPVLDLVLADEGNPRGLVFQLMSACSTLAELAGHDGSPLALMLTDAIAETRAIVADLNRLRTRRRLQARWRTGCAGSSGRFAALSDATGRTYFALLPMTWAEA